MARLLYELCGADPDCLFSPYTWRVRLALGLKGLDFESRPTPFTEIAAGLDTGHAKVPVLVDDGLTVAESFDICTHLEDAHPDTPTLFGGAGGRENAALIDNLIITGLYPTISRMIVKDIHDQLAPADQAYFRETREARFGASLEDVQRGRDKERERFQTFLKPYRRRLDDTAFLGGGAPLFADLALAASFCWAIATSPYDTLDGDKVMHGWLDRVLDTCGQTAALKRAT